MKERLGRHEQLEIFTTSLFKTQDLKIIKNVQDLQTIKKATQLYV